MRDPEKSENQEADPQAPKFMTPQRPVMDAPLDEVEEKPQEAVEAPDLPPAEIRPPAAHPSTEATQELKPEPETPEGNLQPAGETLPTQAVKSPYFPHGIYEDAKSVEAYYERGDAAEADAPLQAQDSRPAGSTGRKPIKWLVLILTALLILVILFLTFAGSTPTGIF